MLRQTELIDLVASYVPDVDESLLNRAYAYSMKAHGSQRRASGDPYFSHPVEVAGILASMKLDPSSIATGLLHDVVEDTDYTCADVENHFGAEIASLVEGVTKLSRLRLKSISKGSDALQAENFRKFVLAVSQDVRVLLVKLADRLHNMRTLEHVASRDSRRRIARETMDIYAPLAQRMGINHWCCELDDLSFRELDPRAWRRIYDHLQKHLRNSETFMQSTISDLATLMKDKGIRVAKIRGRGKTPYSIWRKMQEKSLALEDVGDILAFRIIVPSNDDCYRAMGILHRRYRFLPGGFKDYISTPKPNGYRSLHTHLIGLSQRRFEVQIRTQRMEKVARMGIAAHWSYKQNIQGREGRHYRWMRELLDILNYSDSPEEFLSHTRMQMFRDQVFCFTPKGDIITLPKGATGIDFAYAVHTEVGNRCAVVRVNGEKVPISRSLKNGDSVEIVCSRESHIPSNWSEIMHTGKAQAAIRRLIRRRQKDEFTALGRDILRTLCLQRGITFGPHLFDAQVLKELDMTSAEEIYGAAASGTRDINAILGPILSCHGPVTESKIAAPSPIDPSLSLKGFTAGVSIHYASCCHPLPGDDVIGVVGGQGGIMVHVVGCEQSKGGKSIDLSWETGGNLPNHIGRLHVTLSNQAGSLGRLSSTIARNDSNIANLKITRRERDAFEVFLDLEVRDAAHLSRIIKDLLSSPHINAVERRHG